MGACVCVCVRARAQDREWALACVRVQGVGVCFRACRLTNPGCNAPPYSHLRPLWLHHIFRHYSINGTIFGKKLLNIKCVFSFSQQLLSKTYLILRIVKRDIVINVWKRLHVKYPLFLSDFNKTWIFSTYFRKSRNIKFHQNPSSGSWVVPCGQTDKYDEANSRFSQFYERA